MLMSKPDIAHAAHLALPLPDRAPLVYKADKDIKQVAKKLP